MNRIVFPSIISGTVPAPPGKSQTQRAIAAGLLATGTTVIHNPSRCNDSMAALRVAEGLGAYVTVSETEYRITGGSPGCGITLNCRESGLAMRMFAPIAALSKYPFILTGEGSLKSRPMRMIETALNQLGASCHSNSGLLPLSIQGPMNGGSITIDASVSSQLLTGLLMALPGTPDDSVIDVVDLKSKPYMEMTLDLLSRFGIRIENRDFRRFLIPGKQQYQAHDITIEGDWSGASFLLVAGAIGGEIEVTGLRPESLQADTAILDALQQAGAFTVVRGNSVKVISAPLRAFRFDATNCPDLFPPLAVLAACCEGTSVITGTTRLLHKESNRAASIAEEMRKLGIIIDLIGNEMHIHGGKILSGSVNSHNDHRIAMMEAVAAIRSEGPVKILDSHCVTKSFPLFFDTLSQVGATCIQSST